VASGIADGSHVDAIAQLPELALGTPEAAHAEHGGLEAVRIRSFKRPVKDEVFPCGRDRGWTAGQRLGSRRHFELFLETEHEGVSRDRGLNIGILQSIRITIACVTSRTWHHARGIGRGGGPKPAKAGLGMVPGLRAAVPAGRSVPRIPDQLLLLA